MKKEQKVALITGITGQDGSILAQQLLDKNYVVYGMIRRTTNRNTKNIDTVLSNQNFHLVQGDLSDQNSIARCIDMSQCDELYHLGAQSFVDQSFKTPENTANITGLGTLRILQAIRQSGRSMDIRMYNAASSEMFGKMIENPANQNTPFYPRSPYGVSKVFSYYMTRNYRQSYGMYAVSGILFNHQSQRRGRQFVTRKITLGIKDILQGRIDKIELGNLDAYRDWGSAHDYCKAMHLIMQQEQPHDYVVATGQSHSIREFLQIAFDHAGLGDYVPYVKINPIYFRPAEVDCLRGDASKIHELGWYPQMSFEDLVKHMVDSDLGRL